MPVSSNVARSLFTRLFFPPVFFSGTLGLAFLAGIGNTGTAHASVKLHVPLLTTTEDRPDLALETGLWRSGFVVTDDSPAADPGASPGNSIIAGDMGLEVAETMFGEGVAPGLEETTESSMGGTESTVSLSEWERAFCDSGAGHAKKLTLEGPSAVSIVVAVVGAIVVCGSYLKSGQKS